jgi:hypothetical protein
VKSATIEASQLVRDPATGAKNPSWQGWWFTPSFSIPRRHKPSSSRNWSVSRQGRLGLRAPERRNMADGAALKFHSRNMLRAQRGCQQLPNYRQTQRNEMLISTGSSAATGWLGWLPTGKTRKMIVSSGCGRPRQVLVNEAVERGNCRSREPAAEAILAGAWDGPAAEIP